ncbi:MAG: hypothetical protein UX78_C0026G0003 [Candidatus Amesbacteria bacterium GW2011_GWA2_47_11]|uniref:Glycosyltransferase RgtA/B/C/D-like domain-containing protein n=1 Tax=Candidatus Amesbacteria bacterium GW2011_GWA2_47_11 TaxID=1618357 RepID=A0A0G1TLT2_9BACT|nr:MAG: hypothetical protein UX78_C0026G0003 [Candidatus Amesbacteria bacterium GW2011_GWA2_47_11]
MLSATAKKRLLILIGTLAWSATMVKSGLVYPFGMGFWGPNGHDGVWHISLAENLSRGNLNMPIFAGAKLQNYHLGFDLILATVHKLTAVPVSVLYFQILPPLLAVLIGLAAYYWVRLWTQNDICAWWSVFFIYFGGSFGWLVSWVRTGQLGGESMFWSQQAISTLVNPPFALSILLLLIGLIGLVGYQQTSSPRYFWMTSLAFGLVGFVKIYAGVIALSGLSLLAFRHRRLLPVFFISLTLFLVLFLPLNRNSSQLLVFQPGWFLETMMGLPDRFNWPRYYSAMTNYRLAGDWFRAVPAYAVALIIFILGNFGTRILAFLRLKSPQNSAVNLFLWQGIALGLIFPMLFLQAGTPWNTIQFFYYTQFFAAILAGIFIGRLPEIIKNRKILFTIYSLLFTFTLPTSIDTLRHYLPSRPPAKISTEELEALKFLRRQPAGVVLTPPFDRGAAENTVLSPPRPLYLYESTAYVSALAQNKIAYIYLPDIAHTRPRLSASELGFTTLFANSQVAIWSR